MVFLNYCFALFIAVILLLYLPLTVSGYIVYGDRMNANIILSLGRSIFVVLANISMASHLILAFLIVVNPVCQELENIFDIPHGEYHFYILLYV